MSVWIKIAHLHQCKKTPNLLVLPGGLKLQGHGFLLTGQKQSQTDTQSNFEVACRKLPGSAGQLVPEGRTTEGSVKEEVGGAAVESHVKELHHKDNKQDEGSFMPPPQKKKEKYNYFDRIFVHTLSRPDYI